MRNFIVWDLLNRIENSPEEYIVQRKVSLLESFQFGYEFFYLKIENLEELERRYAEIPSLQEYAMTKYNAHNIGSRNYKSILSFISEDERDFYNNYLNFLKEYESQFSIKEPVNYILVEKPENMLKDVLLGMQQRFLMYFNDYSLADFRAFLDGYFCCKKDYCIPLTPFDKKLKEFTESITCETLNLTGEFVTWDRKYRFSRSWYAWGEITDTHAQHMLLQFWKDLEEFTQET